jgi:hypothetical protein
MKLALTTGLAAVLGISMISSAAIVGPYDTTDPDTLHLWHFDEGSGGSLAYDAVAGGIPVSKQSGATLGNAGFTGFGKAGNTSAASNAILRSSVNSPGLIPAPVGAGGAFTYEALINVSRIDVSQQIFAMDQNGGLSSRPFWFRIVNGVLNVKDIANGPIDYNAAIPTTGVDAFVANEWFHVAVTYDGNDNVADNLKFYWTRVDDSRTEANLIGTTTAVDLSTTATAVYGIGNAFRTVGSGVTSNLEGSIDEVRLSGVARGADQFIFAVPEPASFATGLVGMTLLAGRRRR